MADTLTLEELRATREFQDLTEKQQLFVATYCEGGINGKYDAVQAAIMAYQHKDRNHARIHSYQLLRSLSIIQVLNIFFKTNPTKAFLDQLERAIRNRNLTLAQVHALELKRQVLGLGTLRRTKKLNDLFEHPTKTEKETKKRGRPKQEPPKPANPNSPLYV